MYIESAASANGRMADAAQRAGELSWVPVTDFKDIRGQQHLKRAMEVAAAGAHNVFMLWTKTSRIRVDNSVAVASTSPV